MEQKEIAKKMMPIIKAIADGKTIQFYNGKEWVTETGVNLKEICNDIIEDLAEYRIKSDDELINIWNELTKRDETHQNHYRPFKDCEKLEQYLFIIQIIAERAEDEYSDAIVLMTREAMKLLAQRFAEKSENTEGVKKW